VNYTTLWLLIQQDDEKPKNRTTLPLEEDKLGVYIRLLETDVWIHKTNITMELAIEEKWTKRMNNWYGRNITNIWTSSAKKRHTISLNQVLKLVLKHLVVIPLFLLILLYNLAQS
jgi:hypothetical protein